MTEGTYQSPLAGRLEAREPLTLTTLAKYIPPARASLLAHDELRDPTKKHTARQAEKLRATVNAGEEAKESLMIIAMPLVRTLANKEMQRRRAWNTRVTLEDIVSEGIAGLMRGIRAYNVEGSHTSPTNYLGQWITTEMRRNTESTEHDFSVPYEAMERQRRIRAIRSRLMNELGRDPVDAEIVTAANDGSYQDGSMMGRVNQKPAKTNRRDITLAQVQEERNMAHRTGAVKSLSESHGGDQSTPEEQLAHAVYAEKADDSMAADEASVKRSLTSLLEDSFNLMKMGDIQRDIIRRKFGLLPYTEESAIQDIVIHTGISKHRINRIITSYSSQMTLKNGSFHFLVSNRKEDDVESMGIGWIASTLGKFTPPIVNTITNELTQSLAPHVRDEEFPSDFNSSRNTKGSVAYFRCLTHNGILFSDVYEDDSKIPATRSCPRCNRPSPRIVKRD